MACFLGIDVSTTATKALLIDGHGRQLGVASSSYDLSTPRPLWAEQDPEWWWKAACTSIRRVLEQTETPAESVAAIGLTGQMHGLVLLDAARRVLRPAILWNDQRASAECDLMRQRLGLQELVRLTGNDAYPGFTAPKLLWVRHHEPEIYAQVQHVLLPKDYLRLRLTDQLGSDLAGAGGTLMLDLAERRWSPEVLDAIDVPAQWLPETHEGTEITGRVSASAAELTGLAIGTPVVGGGGDQAAQAVGVGAVRPGIMALTLGTSGVVFASSDQPLVEPEGRLHAFPHAVPGVWHVMGVMLSAAGSLQWYRDVAAAGVNFSDLVAETVDVPPGCDGLTFLPYLSGERTPHADPHARGAFLGLTLSHGRGHLTRAVLEGVAFGLRDNLALMQRVGLDQVTDLRVSGGGASSALWRQILADVLGLDLGTVDTAEGAALGAALLAGVGVGAWGNVDEACAQAVVPGEPTRPNSERRDAYEVAYQRFRNAYPALQGVSWTS